MTDDTVAQPAAWMTEDGRVISAATKLTEQDGGASASAMRAYSIPLFASPPASLTLSDEQILTFGKTVIRHDRPIPSDADTWEFFDDELVAFARAVLAAAPSACTAPAKDHSGVKEDQRG